MIDKVEGDEKMYFYGQMFNPTFVNPQYCHDIAQLQQYQHEQDKSVADAIKAMHDLCEAVNKLDDRHKQTAFLGCLYEIAKANRWM